MRFFNRSVLLHALITLLATLALYAAVLRFGPENSGWMNVAVLLYIGLIVASVLFFNRRDVYTGYFGFNYHLATYLVCVGLPLVLWAGGWIVPEHLGSMAATWGVGVLVHFLIFRIGFRKRALKSYDKSEIFQ